MALIYRHLKQKARPEAEPETGRGTEGVVPSDGVEEVNIPPQTTGDVGKSKIEIITKE